MFLLPSELFFEDFQAHTVVIFEGGWQVYLATQQSFNGNAFTRSQSSYLSASRHSD